MAVFLQIRPKPLAIVACRRVPHGFIFDVYNQRPASKHNTYACAQEEWLHYLYTLPFKRGNLR